MLKDVKKELFAQQLHAGANQSDAYRYAYPRSLKWKDASVHNKAYALRKDGEVEARIKELQGETALRHQVTIDTLLAELDENRKLSIECAQLSAANSATMGKAKLLGLDVQKVEHQGGVTIMVDTGTTGHPPVGILGVTRDDIAES